MRGIVFVIGVCAVLAAIVVRFIGGPPAQHSVSHRGPAVLVAAGGGAAPVEGRGVEIMFGATDHAQPAAEMVGTARADGTPLRSDQGAAIARELLAPSAVEPGAGRLRSAQDLRGQGEERPASPALPPEPSEAQQQPHPDPAAGAAEATAPRNGIPPARYGATAAAPPIVPAPRQARRVAQPAAAEERIRPLVRPEPRPAPPPAQLASVRLRSEDAPAATKAAAEKDSSTKETGTAALQPPARKPTPPAAPSARPVVPANAPSSASSPVAARAASTAPSPQLLEAQQLLGRLGYNVGTPDGVDGSRTRSAIRAFQGTNGLKADGEVSDGLLVLLRRQMKARMQQISQGQAAGSVRLAAASEDTSWISAAARGLQRLLGRDFDSVRAPQELRNYCRANPETWIFDEGRGKMVLCGNLVSARPGSGDQLAQRRD